MTKYNCLKVAKFVFILLILPLFFVAFNNLSNVYAQTANSINFQGKIVRNDTGYEGLNVVNGSPACVVSGADTCDFRIRYYSASSGGTLFFTETFENVEIGQYGGVFELGLGTGTATPGSYSSLLEMIRGQTSVYVEILFSPAGNATYTETFSRMPLRSSAFSMKSKYAEMATGAFRFENSANSSGYTGNDGMVYYDTTNAQLMLYSAGSWQPIAMGGSSLWDGASISSFTHAQFLETSGIATLPNFGIDTTENRGWIHGSSSRTGFSVYSNYNAATDWPLVSFKADASSFGGSILRLVQDGTGTILEGYKGSNPVFRFDNSGNLHLESDGVVYMEKFSTLPTSGNLAPLSGEGCMYTVGANIYWDSACNGSPVSLNTSSSLWSDAGTFTFLTSITDNLVLGGSTVADGTFFFDVSGTSGNYFEVDNADNTQRLFTISNAGNVGIGVDNPTSRLQVAGSSSSISNNTGDLSIASVVSLIFTTNGTERMRILPTGNVGIGTSTPSSLFSVGTSSGFQVNASGDIVSIKGLTYLWPTSHTSNGLLTNNGSGTLSWTSITDLGGVTGTGSTGQIAFFNGSTSVTGDSNFFWDNTNKRLGIGTTTPQSTIDIAGATSEIANSAGPITVLPTDGNLRLLGPGTNYSGSKMTFGDLSNVYIAESGAGDSNMLGLYGVSGISFYTSSTERMRITSNGRVGIGNNLVSPSAGLDVSFTNSATSDFIASRVQVTQAVSGSLTAFGYRVIAETTHASGAVQGLQGNSTQLNVVNGGTVNYAEGITSVANVGTGSTISNLSLLRIFGTTGSGTISNLKGIYISNMNTGTSSNYSIYSEGGTMYHAGNVGIGTTAPGAVLDVVGGIFNTGIRIRNSSTDGAGLSLANSDTGGKTWDILSTGSNNGGGAGNLGFFEEGGNYRMYIKSGGNVGVGTTAPYYKLEVNGNVMVSGTGSSSGLRLEGGNTKIYTDSSNGAIRIVPGNGWFSVRDDTDSYDNLLVYSAYTRVRSKLSVGFAGTPAISVAIGDTDTGLHWISDGNLALYTNNAEIVRFASNGNVGIGTTNPGVKLDVSGQIRLGLSSAATTYDTLVIGARPANDNRASIRLAPYASTSRGWKIDTYDDGSSENFYIYQSTTGTTRFLIGTTQLEVNSSLIRARYNTINTLVVHSSANDADANSTSGVEAGPYRYTHGVYLNMFYEYYSNNSSVAYRITRTGTAMDLAEWYPVGNSSLDGNGSSKLKKGEILCVDNQDSSKVVSCDSTYDNPIGIVSTMPYTTMNIADMDDKRLDDTEVALTGRVPLIVTSKNGSIEIGDYVTGSDIRGVAQKATQKGRVVAKALDYFNPTSCPAASSLEAINWPEDDGTNRAKPCYQLPDGTFVGKIMVFVNVSWYDPSSITTQTQITQSGWYRILKTNSNESTNVRISNSTIGTNQNINLIVDKNNINIMSNFTSGNSTFSKARLNNINGITYLELYIQNPSNNSISVKSDNEKWNVTEISKVDDLYVGKEYVLSGVQFGITDTFKVSENTESISTTQMYSDIGNSMNKWNDIYVKGAIMVGNGGNSEGGIRYNVETKRLEFSNDGTTWREVGDLTSSMVLSAEYSGAILYADGSENNGRMTSDAIETNGTFKNYYEWISDEETPQDYDVLVSITLPSDFIGWNEDAISLDIMTENSASVENNKVDLSLLGNSGTDAQVTDGISKLPANWERIYIKGSDIDSCNKANSTCTLKISMYSKENYFVRVGDITLNYNRGI